MPLPPVHWETFFPCRRGGTPARPSPWAVMPVGRDDSARRTLQGFALRGDLLCPRRQRRQNAAGGGLRWASPPIVAPPPDPRNLRGPNSGGRWGAVRRGRDNDCPRIRAAAAVPPKSRRLDWLDQTGAPDRSGSNLCWRKLAGGSSASRIAYPSLRPAGQSSLISSLRLSNANPLRWALRWGPPAAAIVDGSASARPAPSATAGRNQARL